MAHATEQLAIVHPTVLPIGIVPLHVLYQPEVHPPLLLGHSAQKGVIYLSGARSRYRVYAYGCYLGSVEQRRSGEWLAFPVGGANIFTQGLVAGTRAIAACALGQASLAANGPLAHLNLQAA